MYESANVPHEQPPQSPRDTSGLSPDTRALLLPQSGKDAYILLLGSHLCFPLGRGFHPLFNFLPLGNELCCDMIDFNLSL